MWAILIKQVQPEEGDWQVWCVYGDEDKDIVDEAYEKCFVDGEYWAKAKIKVEASTLPLCESFASKEVSDRIDAKIKARKIVL